jgi:hypothetical protein
MKLRIVSALVLTVVMTACSKKEPAMGISAARVMTEECSREVWTKVPVTMGEIVVPEGTRFCMKEDEHQVRVELPEGFRFFRKGDDAGTKLLRDAVFACGCDGAATDCRFSFENGFGFRCMEHDGTCTAKLTDIHSDVEAVLQTGEVALKHDSMRELGLR